MEYLVKTPSFCYLQAYNNDEFRNSKKLTLNKSGFKEIEDYTLNKLKTPFVEDVINRGFSLKDVFIYVV